MASFCLAEFYFFFFSEILVFPKGERVIHQLYPYKVLYPIFRFIFFFFVFPNVHRILLITYYFPKVNVVSQDPQIHQYHDFNKNFLFLCHFLNFLYFFWKTYYFLNDKWVIHQPHKHQYYDSNPKFRFFVVFQIVFLYFFWITYYFPSVNSEIQEPEIHQYHDLNPKFRFLCRFSEYSLFFLYYLLFPKSERGKSRSSNTSISCFTPKFSISFSFSDFSLFFPELLVVFLKVNGVSKDPQIHQYHHLNPNFLFLFRISNFLYFFWNTYCFPKVKGVIHKSQIF